MKPKTNRQRPLIIRTDILVARPNQNLFIDAEYMPSRESIAPAPIGQVPYNHVLAVGLVLIGLSAVARIEADLHDIDMQIDINMQPQLNCN